MVQLSRWCFGCCLNLCRALRTATYRLFYGRDGKRIVGFANEKPKGDHCHLDGIKRLYRFTDVDKLIEDFMREMNDRRELK